MGLGVKHLLSVADLSQQDVQLILQTARSFRQIFDRPVKKVPTLRGRTILNVFFEPSTRTRASFEIAAKRLSADAVNFSASGTSIVKGETLLDTALTLQAMNPDILVIRHPIAGTPSLLAQHCTRCSVVNGGDGMHEHPTQALLDAYTIEERKGRLEGLKVVIAGDILHSRVARSNLLLLKKMGAEVWLCGPSTLLPPAFESFSVRMTFDFREALADADVVMMLRTQVERQKEVFYPSVKEYFALYGLDRKKLRLAKKDVIVMHPGPLNRGVEIAPDVADDERSVILDQVTNGVAVRMAVLFLLLGVGSLPREEG